MLFKAAEKLKLPMAGICRGGQFLNVMCGGKMWQDVDGHAISGVHQVLDVETQAMFEATSTHHQMMIPDRKEAVLVAVANRCMKKESIGKDGNPRSMLYASPMWEDVEVVAYPGRKVLCFQPHPEFQGHRDGQLGAKYMHYVRRYLKVGA